jgi:hypothetical protein
MILKRLVGRAIVILSVLAKDLASNVWARCFAEYHSA